MLRELMSIDAHRRRHHRAVKVDVHAPSVARFRQRRYDQAALLAVELGRALGLPVALDWLQRVRDTPRQVGLDELQREDNLAGAFAAAAGARGQRVLLVDDVLTTGATAQEAAATLREAGAARVAVARARRVQPHTGL